MAFSLILSFLMGVAKALLWVFGGILIKNHHRSIAKLFSPHASAGQLVNEQEKEAMAKLLRKAGNALVFIGVVMMLNGLVVLIKGLENLSRIPNW